METQVEFRSSAFAPDPAEDELVNPGVYGKALALWVHGQLQGAGIGAADPIAEDWGWMVGIDHPSVRAWVGCANIDGEPGGHRCFVEVVRRRFRKGDPAADQAVVSAVVEVLRRSLADHPEVHGISWLADGS